MNKYTNPDTAPADPAAIVADGRASIYSGVRVWRHACSEFDASLESVMPTIAEDRDLVYAVAADASGLGELVVATTRDEAEAHYRELYGAFHVRNWQPFIEIRTPWYVFFNGVVTMLDRATGQTHQDESLVLFNLCEQEGILGEMAWSRNEEAEQINRTLHQTGTASPAALNRVGNLALHEHYLSAVCNADLDALLATMHERPNIAARNYLPDAESDFIGLMNVEEISNYYSRLWKEYKADSVETIKTLVGDWYVFTELQWNMTRSATGGKVSWHTVEFCPIVGNGVFKNRIGYGSAPVEAS